MWAFKKVSAVAFVTLISACTSTNLGAGNSDGNWTAAITFAEMKNQCSVGGALPVPPKTSEETAAAALAPLIAELGTSLLGAVGAAISEAGQEKSASTTSSPGNASLATISSSRVKPGGLIVPQVQLESVCVRTLVAEFSKRTTEPEGPTALPPERVPFANLQYAKSDVEKAMGNSLPGAIETVQFYSEVLLTPLSGEAKTLDYAAAPTVIWYNAPVKLSRGRLVSMQLAFTRPSAGGKLETALEFIQAFEPDGLAPGTYIVQEDAIETYVVVPGAPIGLAEKSRLDGALQLIESVINQPTNESQFSDLERYTAGVADAKRLARAEALAVCMAASEGKAAKVAVCKSTDEKRRHEEGELADQRREAALSALKANASKLTGPAGRFNVTMTLSESRQANRYFKAIGSALTSGATAAKAPFSSYVGGQLGVSPDAEPASTVAAENKLRSAQFEYATAKSKYDAAVAAGETSKVEGLLRDAITKYGELSLAYDALGRPPIETPPY